MKTKILTGCLALAAVGLLFAEAYNPFQNWEQVKSHEPDIVIARCAKTPIPEPIRHSVMVEADGEIISVLKGRSKPGPARIHFWDDHWPCQNEYYLVFGVYDGSMLDADGNYCVVPLGFSFSTNLLAGKTFDEQIGFMLKRRLEHLNRQMALDQEEKRILEQGVRK